jgi:ABC transporter, permease protein
MFKRTKGEVVFDIFLYAFFALLSFLFIYPFWNVAAMAFNDAVDTNLGGIYFWPRVPTLENFKLVLSNEKIWNGYLVTIARTVLGTLLHVLGTGTFAYALSKKDLVFRKFYLTLCIITMFFGGGLIPSTINMRNLGFMDNFLVFIIPGMYGIMDMIIMKSFFLSLPSSLEESAKIDGANDMIIFFKIVVPSSKPVIATISLMTAVGQWNSWFDANIFILKRPELKPLQLLLNEIIMSAQGAMTSMTGGTVFNPAATSVTPYAIQLATMIIAIGPIIFIYPFFQRYFVKGFMIGAIKE